MFYSCRCCVWNVESGYRHRRSWSIQARAHHEGAASSSPPLGAQSSHNGCCAQSLIPVVMSGIVAVYGLVVSVLIVGRRKWRHIASFIQTSPHCSFGYNPDLSRSVTRLSALFWFCASGSRACVWSYWFGSGICHWHRRGFSTSSENHFLQLCLMIRVVRPSLRSRNQSFRDDGSDPHLRGGAGLVRVRVCCYTTASACDSNLQSIRLIVALIMNTKASDATCS